MVVYMEPLGPLTRTQFLPIHALNFGRAEEAAHAQARQSPRHEVKEAESLYRDSKPYPQGSKHLIYTLLNTTLQNYYP